MKTYLECIPCFFKQLLEASRMAGAGVEVQKRILDEAARALPGIDLVASPPEIAITIHGLVQEYTGTLDPYLRVKEESNRLALGIYDDLVEKLNGSDDRLLTAVELAIAGNIIDYGVKSTIQLGEELDKILAGEQGMIRNEDPRFFRYDDFRSALEGSETILYLADNAGEIVFDRVLLEEIRRIYPGKDISFAVKGSPAINDALEKDAIDCGINTVARVISSGSDAPGTLPARCSESFLELYRNVEMVISKGQGNFEALSDTDRPVFFLLLAKCPVIAKEIGCRVNDIVLMHHQPEITE